MCMQNSQKLASDVTASCSTMFQFLWLICSDCDSELRRNERRGSCHQWQRPTKKANNVCKINWLNKIPLIHPQRHADKVVHCTIRRWRVHSVAVSGCRYSHSFGARDDTVRHQHKQRQRSLADDEPPTQQLWIRRQTCLLLLYVVAVGQRAGIRQLRNVPYCSAPHSDVIICVHYLINTAH